MTETTVKPQIGMDVTECRSSGHKAGTIIEVSPSGRQAKFRYDKLMRVDLNDKSQVRQYRYEPDLYGEIKSIFLSGDGNWRVYSEGQTVALDWRAAYHDLDAPQG